MKDQPPRARKPDRRVSIRDVAEHCRLSTATVSLVLNGQGQRFTPQTQARVRQSVEELGYRPNVLARGLRTNRTRTIGVVADQIITTPYATSMIEGVQEACWERGYLPFVVGTNGDPQRTAEAMDALVGRQVEGILVGAMYHKRVSLEPTLRGLVAVGMNVRPESGDAPSFVPDELGAAEVAVRTLVECDHQRIVHITEPPNRGLARGLRVQGYEQAMASAGLGTTALVVETEPDEEFSDGAERISHQLLTGDQPPTAFFTFNDRMAVGIYRTARRLGLDIPRDLSVIGFDDQVMVATELRPMLTTMALPHYEMGHRAATVLLDAIAEEDSPAATRGGAALPCPLVLRGSVGTASP